MHRWNQPMNKTTQPKQIQNNIFKALHNLLAAELLICGTVCPLKLRTFLVKTSLTDQFAMFSCEVLSSRFYVILIALWYWVWIYVLCFLCFYVIFMFFNVFYVIVCIVILFLRLLVSTTCYIILLQHVTGPFVVLINDDDEYYIVILLEKNENHPATLRCHISFIQDVQ